MDWSRFRAGIGPENIAQTTAGIFIDLNGDGTDEFVLLSASGGPVYQKRGGHWEYVGPLYPEGAVEPWPVLVKALSGGNITAVAPAWKDVTLGTHRYRMSPSY